MWDLDFFVVVSSCNVDELASFDRGPLLVDARPRPTHLGEWETVGATGSSPPPTHICVTRIPHWKKDPTISRRSSPLRLSMNVSLRSRSWPRRTERNKNDDNNKTTGAFTGMLGEIQKRETRRELHRVGFDLFSDCFFFFRCRKVVRRLTCGRSRTTRHLRHHHRIGG